MRLFICTAFFVLAVSALHAGPHTVQKGETIDDIAALYGITPDSIAKANQGIKIFTGLTIEIPVSTLVTDISDSHLFRKFQNMNFRKIEKAHKTFLKGFKKQTRLRPDKMSKDIERIISLYEEAAEEGSTDALYQLGRYLVHGRMYSSEGYPTFNMSVNKDVEQFSRGIEYLQIAAIAGKNRYAAVELAMACGYEESPIRNPYLCLGMLETYKTEFDIPLGEQLSDMYEFGYGISIDYIQAYINAPSRMAGTNGKKSRKERILEKIEAMPSNFESSKYGVGLNSEALLSIAFTHYRDSIMDPEGFFWLHRAARSGDADANWVMAGILQNRNFVLGTTGGDTEGQVIHFARQAAEYGNQEAKDYVKAYDKYQEAKRQERLRQEIEIAERKRQKRQMWLETIGSLVQVAAQTYVAVEASKVQKKSSAQTYSMPQMSFSSISGSQQMAQNQLALQQIAQYTVNRSVADWNGTPMTPTDMSAVNLGTDMSPGSPLWMWSQQQEINSMQTANAKAGWQLCAFYKMQADRISQQMAENPMQPVEGFIDYDGQWISRGMIEADNGTESSTKATVSEKTIREDYFQTRYGYKECSMCHGSQVCQTCNGKKSIHNSLGEPGYCECPNCWQINGKASGLCNICQGKGYVYGLK